MQAAPRQSAWAAEARECEGPHVCGGAPPAPSAGTSSGPGGTASGNAVRLVPTASADICAVHALSQALCAASTSQERTCYWSGHALHTQSTLSPSRHTFRHSRISSNCS